MFISIYASSSEKKKNKQFNLIEVKINLRFVYRPIDICSRYFEEERLQFLVADKICSKL